MRRVLRSPRAVHLLAFAVRVVNALIPKRRQAILALYPDFESSTDVLIRGLQKRQIDVVLVLTELPAEPPAGVTCCLVGSSRCLWLFLRSQWLMFTHPRFVGMTSRRQRIVNLWHGMPIKAIQLLDGSREPVHADLTIASGPVFVGLLASAFGVPEESVKVLPHPRLEALVEGSTDALVRLGIAPRQYQRVVAWMPTYRGRPYLEGGGLASGMLLDEQLLTRLSELMERENSLLLLRRHPYEASNAPIGAPHVRELLDAELREARLGTYDVLAGVDALVSDISSVWIDYLYRDRPTLIYFPDRASYEGDRGLLLEPFDDWSPSPVLTNEDELLTALEQVLRGEDRHRERRHAVAVRMIEAPPRGSVDAILAAVAARHSGRAPSAGRSRLSRIG